MSAGANFKALQIVWLFKPCVNTQQPWVPVSSCVKLKMKVLDARNAGDGYKKIAKCCQLAVSTVWNVIERWQIRATVEVKMRSGRSRKLSERTAHMLVRKANQDPHLTAKNLQEDLADSGVVVHHSTVQRCLHKQDLHGRVSRRKPYLIIKSNVRSMQRNIYSSLMRFGSKCCGLMKWKSQIHELKDF